MGSMINPAANAYDEADRLWIECGPASEPDARGIRIEAIEDFWRFIEGPFCEAHDNGFQPWRRPFRQRAGRPAPLLCRGRAGDRDGHLQGNLETLTARNH